MELLVYNCLKPIVSAKIKFWTSGVVFVLVITITFTIGYGIITIEKTTCGFFNRNYTYIQPGDLNMKLVLAARIFSY